MSTNQFQSGGIQILPLIILSFLAISTVLVVINTGNIQILRGRAAVYPSPSQSCKILNSACTGSDDNCCAPGICSPFSGGYYCISPTCTEGVKRCVTSSNPQQIEQCRFGKWERVENCPRGCTSSPVSCKPQAVTVDLKVNGGDGVSLPYNSSVTLSWTSSGASYCLGVPGGGSGTSGSISVIVTQTSSYTVTCTNSSTQAQGSDSVTVTVQSPRVSPSTAPKPTPQIPKSTSLPSPRSSPLTYSCSTNGNYCIPFREDCQQNDFKGLGGSCASGKTCCERNVLSGSCSPEGKRVCNSRDFIWECIGGSWQYSKYCEGGCNMSNITCN
ncbi:MAG: hypothetical protein AAB874_08305, partial [Patescibacteria group bacterium]